MRITHIHPQHPSQEERAQRLKESVQRIMAALLEGRTRGK